MATKRKAMEEATSSLPSSTKIPKLENDLKSEEISDHFFNSEKLVCLSQPFLREHGDGSVFKGFWKENGKEKEVAVRRIKVSECTENWKDIVDNHLTEFLNHNNVLRVFGYEEGSDHFRYFALELYVATLEQFCNCQYTGPMPSDAKVLCQIANGINYLHSNNLSHGNLNPQTILVSQGHPVRMKISDFGLRNCVDFPKRIPSDDGNIFSQRNVNSTNVSSDQTPLPKMRTKRFKGEPQILPFPIDDDFASLMPPIDATVDPIEIARVSNTNPMTNTARNDPKDSSSYPGNWMLAGSWSEFTDQDGNVLIHFNPTVHGDVFAAGCLFFYFIKRGLHPFGDAGTILANISAKNPVNLDKLDPKHFAYESIQNLLGDPPTDGTQWLQIAAQTFQAVLPLKIDESKEIGRGGFATIFAGTYEGNDVAVKKMPAKVIGENGIDFEREMELHKELDHENVLKLLHVDEEKDLLYKFLVFELCSGTLTQYCDKKKRESEGKPYRGPDLPDLPSDQLVLYQIAIGLDYVHSQNLVHRDIKPDNILISLTEPVHVKLSDFGFCKRASPEGTFSQSGLKGTLNWMAPEMLEIFNADPDNDHDDLPHGTIESDTFSAGCVFFFLLTLGSHPFGNPRLVPANICSGNPVTFRNTIKKLEGDMSGSRLYDLIGEMIQKKEERIALTKVIEKLTALISTNCQFKEIERSFPKISGGYESRFHPTDPVLACGLGSSVTILKAAVNGSIPFSNWRIEKEFQRQTQIEIKALEWNVNGTQLAAGCDDGTVIVWSYPSGDVVFKENKHSWLVNLTAWNPFNKDVLATLYIKYGKNLLFWNSRRDNGDAETLERDDRITSVACISANQIAIGLKNGKIEICEIDEDKGTSRIVRQLRHSKSEDFDLIFGLKWNEKTEYLASCSFNGWIKTWSTDSDQPVHTLKVDSDCYSFAWYPNLKTDIGGGIDKARKDKENFIFACGLSDRSIVVWNALEVEEANRIRILPQNNSRRVRSLSFSSDGQFLSSVDLRGELIIWSTKTWLPVFIYETSFDNLSWMSNTGSFSAPAYKLGLGARTHKIRVIEESLQNENSHSVSLALPE